MCKWRRVGAILFNGRRFTGRLTALKKSTTEHSDSARADPIAYKL